ncbi:MAG: serine hydrolase domain-containing protein [Planctomycetota bacterium]
MIERTTYLALVLAVCGTASAISRGDLGFSPSHLAHIGLQVERELARGEFAGCVVAIGRSEGLGYLQAFGHRTLEPTVAPMTTDTVFDMASVTKPVATATSVMLLVERGRLRLADRIAKHLPGLTGEGTKAITVEQLLTHNAGYVPDNPLADFQHGVDEAWRRLLALEPKWPPGSTFKYSDVGFELLGRIVENVDGRPLDRFAREEIFEPLGMNETGYLPAAALRDRAAASEQRDGEWLVGEVHDPRAHLLGGVAGHAGLFSTAEDLARYARCLLRGGTLDGARLMSPLTLAEMTRPRDVASNLRGAGWDMRSGYSSNRGELLSPQAFGHGGFTGTAMWIDPANDLFVIFLSNRLHPDGKGSVNPLAGRIGSIAAASIVGE